MPFHGRGGIGAKRLKRVVLAILGFLAISLILSSTSDQSVALQSPNVPIPETFFGMHVHHTLRGAPTRTPWPSARFGSWRLWDAYVAWPYLEPEKGCWNFTALDKYVDMAEQHGVEVLLPLGLSPTWASSRPGERSRYVPGSSAEPRNIEDWDDYVLTVAKRYKGRIRDYEIWNEPNEKGFFSGTPEQMVRLVRRSYVILKEVDPSNTVVSPSATGEEGVQWLERFLQLGGGKYIDVVGYHFYDNEKPPEAMLDLVAKVKAVMSRYGVERKSLWDTELGWARPKPFPSEKEAAAYVARSYILHWAAGVNRLYWFAWDQQVYGLQMVGVDGRSLKPAGLAYGEVENWLVGARMTSCESNSKGMWTCEITRKDGYKAWILWDAARNANFSIPRNWRAQDFRDLSGIESLLNGRNTIVVSPSPILVEKFNP
jgi:hypothetical protein